MDHETKEKKIYTAYLFIPVFAAFIDVAVDFLLPTNENVISDGTHYFGYLMIIVAIIFIVIGLASNRSYLAKVAGCEKVPFRTVLILFLGLIDILTDKIVALPSIYFPSINIVLASAINEREMLFTCTVYSIRLLFFGIIIGGIVGILTGIIIGWNKKINYWLFPIIRFIGPMPTAIWIPMSLLIFPGLFSASVFIVALTMWFPTTIQTSSGIQNVSKGYYDVANTMGASTIYQIIRIAIPAAAPQIFVGIFSGVTTSFISLMLAELMGSKYGIGWYINWKQQIMAYSYVWVALVILAILCFLTIKLLFVFRKKFLSWQGGIIRW